MNPQMNIARNGATHRTMANENRIRPTARPTGDSRAVYHHPYFIESTQDGQTSPSIDRVDTMLNHLTIEPATLNQCNPDVVDLSVKECFASSNMCEGDMDGFADDQDYQAYDFDMDDNVSINSDYSDSSAIAAEQTVYRYLYGPDDFNDRDADGRSNTEMCQLLMGDLYPNFPHGLNMAWVDTTPIKIMCSTESDMALMGQSLTGRAEEIDMHSSDVRRKLDDLAQRPEGEAVYLGGVKLRFMPLAPEELGVSMGLKEL